MHKSRNDRGSGCEPNEPLAIRAGKASFHPKSPIFLPESGKPRGQSPKSIEKEGCVGSGDGGGAVNSGWQVILIIKDFCEQHLTLPPLRVCVSCWSLPPTVNRGEPLGCVYLQEMVAVMAWIGTHPTFFESLDQTTASNRLANIIYFCSSYISYISFLYHSRKFQGMSPDSFNSLST